MPTFYIAGRTKNIATIQLLAKSLEKSGMTWSYNWTEHELFPKPYIHGDPAVHAFATQCVSAIQESDLFILIAKDSDGARGCFIELGVALASQVETWIIGDENPSVFSALNQVHHAETIEDLLKQKGIIP